MSTSLLYHAFGVRGCEYVKTTYHDAAVTFTGTTAHHALSCPHCQSVNVIRKGRNMRTFHSLPIGGRKTFIAWEAQRIRCHDCGLTSWLKPPFAIDRNRHTKSFARYALELLRVMNISDVATHLGLS